MSAAEQLRHHAADELLKLINAVQNHPNHPAHLQRALKVIDIITTHNLTLLFERMMQVINERR